MTVTAPPRPPLPAHTAPESKPLEREEIEALVAALIEEARRETRRRHRRYWMLAALAILVGAVVLILLQGGAASQTASPARSVRSGATGGTPSSKIAFLRGGPASHSAAPYRLELDVVNVDGSGLRKLGRGPWSRDDQGFYAVPDWSPDGRKLVFAKRVTQSGSPCRPAGRCNDEIYVINADGTDLRRLTRNAVPDGHPVWSPDGQTIAFLRRRDGPAWSIYVMNTDGSNQRKLTSTPRRQGEPTWSPDGQNLAFSGPAGRLGAADIFVINADGSDLRNVTNTVTTSFDFAWSPDARQIAYVEIHIPEPSSPLYIVNADGTGKRRLTRSLAVDLGSPSWSPDGRTLAFTGDGGIYTVHADGTGLRKLTSHGHSPKWSPDGRRILFASGRDGETDIFVMNTDGSQQLNLTHTPNISESAANWAPSPD